VATTSVFMFYVLCDIVFISSLMCVRRLSISKHSTTEYSRTSHVFREIQPRQCCGTDFYYFPLSLSLFRRVKCCYRTFD